VILPGMEAAWRGMRGTVFEICNDGLHILFAVEGRKWRVPIPEAKFGRKEGEYVA
jgi:hypothetical protein